jgi:hypothetical protein
MEEDEGGRGRKEMEGEGRRTEQSDCSMLPTTVTNDLLLVAPRFAPLLASQGQGGKVEADEGRA